MERVLCLPGGSCIGRAPSVALRTASLLGTRWSLLGRPCAMQVQSDSVIWLCFQTACRVPIYNSLELDALMQCRGDTSRLET